LERLFRATAIFLLMVTIIGGNAGSAGAVSSRAIGFYAPLRFIAEAQGASVDWNDATQMATVKSGNGQFTVRVGSNQAVVNGQQVELDSAPLVVNQRIKVPLDFINQALGKDITEDECLKTLAAKSMELFKTGSLDDLQVFCSDRLNRALPASIAQMVGLMQALGQIEPQEVGLDKNAVHQNVTITYATTSMGKVAFTFKFDQQGLLDDLSPIRPVSDVAYKAPAYDQPGKYMESQVVVGSGEWQLPATMTIPRGKGPFPAVVLVHGSGQNDRDETIGPLKVFRDLAVGLASQEVAVLRYEKRTLEHNFATTLVPDFTVYDETIDDAISAADLLKNVPGIDAGRIFVLGHSQGGMCIPRILNGAAEGTIKGAVIMSGPTRPFLEIMPDQYKYLMSLGMATQEQYDFIKAQMDMINDPGFDPLKPPQGYVMGTPTWWADIKNYDPAAEAAKQTIPLLILQGQRDYQVTFAQDFKGWQEALAGRNNVTYKFYPKLNHVYTEGEGTMSSPAEYAKQANIPAYVIDDISRWIKTTSD